MSEKTSRAWWIWREEELRRGYIEEICALEAQISDESKAELALERSRGDAAEKRAAKSEAERDQLRKQVEKLLGRTDAVLALRNPLTSGLFYLPDNPEARARLRRLKQAAESGATRAVLDHRPSSSFRT
jgi:hypothetical protein